MHLTKLIRRERDSQIMDLQLNQLHFLEYLLSVTGILTGGIIYVKWHQDTREQTEKLSLALDIYKHHPLFEKREDERVEMEHTQVQIPEFPEPCLTLF